jgi:hypothetical protein
LPEFIEFSKFSIDKIRSGNKDLVKNKVVSWFEECLSTREDLEIRWSKLVKDEYPKETQKLKELWKKFGGRKLQGADDENIMRRIAIKAYNYFENLNGKYQWGLTERYPISRFHYLFDVGQAEGWDWGKAQPSFLLSPKMFLEKLPMHWVRIALASTVMSPTMESKMEIDNKDLREVNSHFGWDENGSREKTLAVIAAQQSNDKDKDEGLEDY